MASVCACCTGLSPRVRGNLARVGVDKLRRRSIPARAGEPMMGLPVPPLPPVYPRACGGTGGPSPNHPLLWGLSPRVRGNRRQLGPLRRRDRSIPARAGEPQSHAGNAFQRWVYPRACGGTSGPRSRGMGGEGLSPRVRGNRQGAAGTCGTARSIPARAGEPLGTAPSSCPWRVYPRACGGTSMSASFASTSNGLSPRVRGNLDVSIVRLNQQRSIPARAGEPFPHRSTARRRRRVYPRACGGTAQFTLLHQELSGLSPRVRGNPRHRKADPVHQGSIPARAGEPAAARYGQGSVEVYPRACGGTCA